MMTMGALPGLCPGGVRHRISREFLLRMQVLELTSDATERPGSTTNRLSASHQPARCVCLPTAQATTGLSPGGAPFPVSPCEGPGAVCAYLGCSLALSPDAALRGREVS